MNYRYTAVARDEHTSPAPLSVDVPMRSLSYRNSLLMLACVLTVAIALLFLSHNSDSAPTGTHTHSFGLTAAGLPFSPSYNPLTHTRVTSLCQPASMLLDNASYTGLTEGADFYSLPLPGVAFEDGRWMLWEVGVDVLSGEVRVPLIEEVRSRGLYNYQLFKEQRLSWMSALLAERKVTCSFEYEDASEASVSTAYLFHVVRSKGSVPWLSCLSRPLATPSRLTLSVATDSISPSSAVLPLCTAVMKRQYAVAQLRSYYSWHIDEICDWLDYHYKIGFDHVLFYYRWPLTPYERTALQPYFDSGLIELRYWPQRVGSDGVSGWPDQDVLLVLSSMRLHQYAQWVMAPDFDEWLYITAPGIQYTQRPCNSSLLCTSPVRQYLDSMRQYAVVQYYTWNFVPTHLVQPPADKLLAADRWRYPHIDAAANALPLPVQRVWKRQFHDLRAAVVSKWLFQPAHTHEWATHGGSSLTRPHWTDREGEQLHAKHFHAYEMPEQDRAAYWAEQAIRDTGVSDVLMDDTLWPQGTSAEFLEARRRQQEVRRQKVTADIEAKAAEGPAVQPA